MAVSQLIEATRPPQMEALRQPQISKDRRISLLIFDLPSEGDKRLRRPTARLPPTRHPIGAQLQ